MSNVLNGASDDLTGVGNPGSLIWWVTRLNTRLMWRRPRYEILDRYYRGDHVLPEGIKEAREAYKDFQRKARANYMKMVADSVNERLSIVGFRTGAEGTNDTDSDAWDVWQSNHLDSDQGMVHIAALKYPDAYVIVGPPKEGGQYPIITVEDPRQIIGEADPIDRRVLRAALKTWVDDVSNMKYAILYMPDSISYWQAPYIAEMDLIMRDRGSQRAPFVTQTEGWRTWKPTEANPIGIVPVVRFVAQPDERGDGMGEYEDLIDVQDRINETIFNRLIITRSQAYQQRWIKGLNVKDENGEDSDLPFIPGVDNLWAVEDADVQFGQFDQADIGPLLNAVKADLQELVVRAALPPTYVMGDVVNVAADAVAAIEERLVAKVRSRAAQLGEAWEQVMRLAFTYLDQPSRIAPDAEVQWASPQRQTIATLATAAVQMNTVGVPFQWIMEKLGYTPSEIDRMQAARLQETMMDVLKAPPPQPAQPAQPSQPGQQETAEPEKPGQSDGPQKPDVGQS